MGLPRTPLPRWEKRSRLMKNRAKANVSAQVGAGLLFTAQLLLPMIEGLVRSRRELFAWVQQVGISALNELFELDAIELAGSKGKHCSQRSHYRWGSAQIALPFWRAANSRPMSARARDRWRRSAAQELRSL